MRVEALEIVLNGEATAGAPAIDNPGSAAD
jgi:hypothetical protein